MHAGLGWGFKDVFMVAGSITVLLSHPCVCVLNYFYFILPTPLCRSLGPKHTLVRETTFHWELLAPQTTETFHCPEGIWHRSCRTAVPPPRPQARGHRRQFPFVFFSPPSPPTKESNQAMVRSNSTSNRPQQTGNNLWSSEDASRQPQRAQRRKDFTRSSEVLSNPDSHGNLCSLIWSYYFSPFLV